MNLETFNGAGLAEIIRIDKQTNKGSVIDVIVHVSNNTARYAAMVFNRLSTENDLYSKCIQLRINGKGKLTPVASMETLVELIWLCPGKAAKGFRAASAHNICRLLRGDLSLIPEIEQRYAALTPDQGHDCDEIDDEKHLQAEVHKGPRSFIVLNGALAPGRLLTSYKNCVIVYLLEVGIIVADSNGVETEFFFMKYGRTEYADDRLSTHVRYFDSVKVCAFFEVARGAETENDYKNELLALNIKPGIKIKDKTHVELFVLPATKTIEDLRELMRQVVESCLQSSQMMREREIREYQKYIVASDLEKQRLEIEKRKMDDIIAIKRMDIEMQVQLKKIEADKELQIKQLEVELIKLEIEKLNHLQSKQVSCVSPGQISKRQQQTSAPPQVAPVEPIDMSSTGSRSDLRPVATKVPSPSHGSIAVKTAPVNHTLRPILQNRQARRVAEIDPVGKTVIAIYNKREDVKTRYNMCLKTLKKKIENEEVFLDRRWIEPDYIPDDHVYHDIIRAFEQQT